MAPRTRLSLWAKLGLAATLLEILTVGVLSALIWVIVRHHKETVVTSTLLLVAQGDSLEVPVATAAATSELRFEQLPHLTLSQLQDLRHCIVPLNATRTVILSVTRVETAAASSGQVLHSDVVVHLSGLLSDADDGISPTAPQIRIRELNETELTTRRNDPTRSDVWRQGLVCGDSDGNSEHIMCLEILPRDDGGHGVFDGLNSVHDITFSGPSSVPGDIIPYIYTGPSPEYAIPMAVASDYRSTLDGYSLDSVCNGIQIQGNWTSDSAMLATLELLNPLSGSIGPGSTNLTEAVWTAFLEIEQPEEFGCVFTGQLTLRKNETVETRDFIGIVEALQEGDGSSARLIVEQVLPVTDTSEKPIWLSRGKTLAFLEDESTISLEILSRCLPGMECDEGSPWQSFNRVVAISMQFTREGTDSALPPRSCPSLEGRWSSESYDALSVNETGGVAELQGLNMSLEVSELTRDNCTFFAINSWSNGEIGADEIVAGIVHHNGHSLSIMEYVPSTPEASVTTAIIIGEIGPDKDVVTFEYAGLNAVDMRAVAFSTSLTQSETGNPVAPMQNACASNSLVGTWESLEPYTEMELELETRALSSTENLTMSLTIYYQDGCRFAGIVTESDVVEMDAIAATIKNDGTSFEVVEAGSHGVNGATGVVNGELLSANHMLWRFTGSRIEEGSSFAVAFYSVLEKTT